jgi:hypothetical protein
MVIPRIRLVQEGPWMVKPYKNARLTQSDLYKRYVVISWSHTKQSVIVLDRHDNIEVFITER